MEGLSRGSETFQSGDNNVLGKITVQDCWHGCLAGKFARIGWLCQIYVVQMQRWMFVVNEWSGRTGTQHFSTDKSMRFLVTMALR